MRKFMRFFFHHFYHALAWTYDFVAAVVSIGRWKGWGRAALPHLRGKRVLELGFGPGHLLAEMNRGGFEAVGLDESKQMIRQAKHALVRSRLPVSLSCGYAQFLPFASDSFDSVLSTFPSEYIFDSRTLSEAWRVLKPDGRFVIVPMAWIGGKSLADKLASFLFRITGQSGESRESAREKAKALFTEQGFRVEMVEVEQRYSVALVVVAEKAGRTG